MKTTSKYDQIIYASLFNVNDIIEESQKEARAMVASGKITEEEFDKIRQATPHPKFMGWVARRWVKGEINDQNLQSIPNYLNEWSVYVRNRKTKSSDINAYKTFQELTDEVDHLNHSGDGRSKKQRIEAGYNKIVDDEKWLIYEVSSHEGSQYVGCNFYKLPDGSNPKWCITFSDPSNWNNYHMSEGKTFYMVKMRGDWAARVRQKFGRRWEMFVISFPMPIYKRDARGNVLTDPNTGEKILDGRATQGPMLTDIKSLDHVWSSHEKFIREFIDFIQMPVDMSQY